MRLTIVRYACDSRGDPYRFKRFTFVKGDHIKSRADSYYPCYLKVFAFTSTPQESTTYIFHGGELWGCHFSIGPRTAHPQPSSANAEWLFSDAMIDIAARAELCTYPRIPTQPSLELRTNTTSYERVTCASFDGSFIVSAWLGGYYCGSSWHLETQHRSTQPQD